MEVELIKEGQGFRQNVYKSTQGYPTIGYGHKLVPGQNLKKITKSEAESLLQKDLQKARQQIQTYFGKETLNQLGPVRSAVLIDMAYNLGSVRWPKLTAAIKSGDYQQAAFEILNSKYAKQVGDRAIRNAQIMRSGKFMTKEQAKNTKLKVANLQKKLDLPSEDDFEQVQVGRKEISRQIISVSTVGNTKIVTWKITYEIKKQRRLKQSAKKKLEQMLSLMKLSIDFK